MNQTSLEQKYAMLRKTLANYLLLQVDTFVSGLGIEAIGPAMEILTGKKADLKVREIKEHPEANKMELLSQHLVDSMGETFNSEYDVKSTASNRTVTLTRCGCIQSVIEESDQFELPKSRVRSIFCGTCIGSYKKAAERLELGFKGKLSKEGCMMSFSTPV